jgi:hypothetical protein
VYVVKLGGFFIEDLQGGGEVVGRFMEVLTPGEPCASSGGPSFLSGMGLVE